MTLPIDMEKVKADATNLVEEVVALGDGETPDRLAVAVEIQRTMVRQAKDVLIFAELVLAEVQNLAEEKRAPKAETHKVTIVAANIGDQQDGCFHVHAQGCTDLRRYHDRPMNIEVATRYDAGEFLFEDVVRDREGEEGFDFEQAVTEAMNGEMKFFPCAKALAR
jgi:hypothetical protein